MDIKDRIIQFIEFKRISINAFEKSIGASKSYISNTKNISAEVASNILLIYSDLSAEWLFRGKGEMLLSDSSHIMLDSLKEEVISLRAENAVLREVVGLKKRDSDSLDTKSA